MRLSWFLLPLFLLIVVPFYAIWHEWGVFKLTLAFMGIFGVRFVQLVRKPILGKDQVEGTKMVLETIHVSHYVEKVRWCLDYAGIPYEEEQDCGILGRFFLGRSVPILKVPAKDISISNSSDILRYLYGITAGKDDQRKKFFEANKEMEDLEMKLDVLGEDLRRYSYHTRFSLGGMTRESMRRAWGIHQTNVPKWQKVIMEALMPLMIFLVTKIVNTSSEAVEVARRDFHRTLDEIDDMLSDGRKFLQGTSKPTYIDLAFASITAVLVRPRNQGGGAIQEESLENPVDLGQDYVRERNLFLERPCGKLATKLYKEYRTARLTSHRL